MKKITSDIKNIPHPLDGIIDFVNDIKKRERENCSIKLHKFIGIYIQ